MKRMTDIQERRDYYSRVRVTDRCKCANDILVLLAAEVLPIKLHRPMVIASLEELARVCYMDVDNFEQHLQMLSANGIVTVGLDRNKETGEFEVCAVFLHGPWDNYDDTGVPFIEYSQDFRFENFEESLPNWVLESREQGI